MVMMRTEHFIEIDKLQIIHQKYFLALKDKTTLHKIADYRLPTVSYFARS